MIMISSTLAPYGPLGDHSVSAQRKATRSTAVRHPARPREGALDIKAHHELMNKRFPKILAKLAE